MELVQTLLTSDLVGYTVLAWKIYSIRCERIVLEGPDG